MGVRGWVDSTLQGERQRRTAAQACHDEEQSGSGSFECSFEGVFDVNQDVGLPTEWADVDFTSPDSGTTEDWKTFENETSQSTFNYQADGGESQGEASVLSPSIWDTSFNVLDGGSWEDPTLQDNSNAVFEVVAEYTSIFGDQNSPNAESSGNSDAVEEVDDTVCQSPMVKARCLASPSPGLEISLAEPSKLFLLRHCK